MLSQFIDSRGARRVIGKARGQPPADEGAPDGGGKAALRPDAARRLPPGLGELPSRRRTWTCVGWICVGGWTKKVP